jgi:hypothetical protein
MNQREKDIMKNGEVGQGEGLHSLKMRKEGNANKNTLVKERSYSKNSNSSGGVPFPLFRKNDPGMIRFLYYSYIIDRNIYQPNFYKIGLEDRSFIETLAEIEDGFASVLTDSIHTGWQSLDVPTRNGDPDATPLPQTRETLLGKYDTLSPDQSDHFRRQGQLRPLLDILPIQLSDIPMITQYEF